MFSASRCVILVRVPGAFDSGCEDTLRELDRRGCAVWRVHGGSDVDAVRNQMANDTLAQAFVELMWIDADLVFDSDDVDRVRRHNLPIICGIYPKTPAANSPAPSCPKRGKSLSVVKASCSKCSPAASALSTHAAKCTNPCEGNRG